MNIQSSAFNKRKKILVADNSKLIRTMIKNFLESNYDVIEAENGNEIISLVEEHLHESGSNGFLLVILSMELSDSNGFEVAARLRKKHNNKCLPIILHTSNNKREIILKALEAGINDYIVKPFPQELLVSKIKKLEQEIPVDNLEQSEVIARIPFFHGVPESEVAYILNTCSKTIIKETGEIVCSQNEKNYDLYILLEGRCDIIYNNKKVSEIRPVDIIGEMGFLEEKSRSATVIATEPSRIIVLNKELFDSFLNEDRAISEIICKNVIHTFSERIIKTNVLIEKLKTLAYELFKN